MLNRRSAVRMTHTSQLRASGRGKCLLFRPWLAFWRTQAYFVVFANMLVGDLRTHVNRSCAPASGESASSVAPGWRFGEPSLAFCRYAPTMLAIWSIERTNGVSNEHMLIAVARQRAEKVPLVSPPAGVCRYARTMFVGDLENTVLIFRLLSLSNFITTAIQPARILPLVSQTAGVSPV